MPDISAAFKQERSRETDKIFANEFLATFPTKHKYSTDEKDFKKAKNISRIKTTTLTEKSSRQERRNARERGRKARLNAAFQVLRSIVPQNMESHEQRKLTQVEILRLAKNYISSLTTILETCKDNISVNYAQDNALCAANLFTNINKR